MEITLKPLTKDNLRFLLLVRNDESTRTQLKNDTSFTLDECEDWFEKLEPSWLMIYNENSEEVGYLRIDGNLIGCDIHPDYRRKGYARKAYKEYLKDKTFAELDVFEDNHAKSLYEELGFKETGEVEFIRGRKYLKMVYENRN